MTQPAPLTISDVCTSCSLCCNGSLFSYVEITEKEENTLQSLGFKTEINQEGERQFEQPCPKLKEGCCTIYQDRPQGCKVYNCYLINGIKEGEISPEDALQTVFKVKEEAAWFFETLEDIFEEQPEEASPDELHYNWIKEGERPETARDLIYDRLYTLKKVHKVRAFTAAEKSFLEKAKSILTLISEDIHPHDLMDDLKPFL
ncbi:YkgJ family cysteine cluster protein [Temperatibacter marinus]|uniref:YkgJ family cysteine cluster protein n=1 Tax=Temperatibacter marinus TaxID=1456591 RepID=A0AA52EFI3_9PROT|nr:YkgJ family cysteine cluster protein [Temperatibacter marinus]WND03765.1 YkgJ family cysteine cluster protein [Temperatibacter marinus]